MAVAYWTQQMAKDTERTEEEHREQLLDAELERFIENALGTKTVVLKWTNA